MCFSESASFTSSALLSSTGLYCIRTALNKDKSLLPLACVPVAFGLQQGVEGIVWAGLDANDSAMIHAGSLAFLFFSHWFWLFWIPWVVLSLEPNPVVQQMCRFCAGTGFLYGVFLYLPLLLNEGWLFAAVTHGSIEYQAKFIGDAIPVVFPRLLYALIILAPLVMSSNSDIKVFGELVAAAAFVTYLVFNYSFVSVWCFFAALLSLYIVHVILKTQGVQLPQDS